VLTALFNLGVNLVVVLGFLLAYGVSPHWTWLGLPLILAALVALTTAVATTLAALYPRFRDTGIIWGVVATALFYATPVLYPLDIVPQPLRNLLALNPLAPLFELARKWVVDPTAPEPVSVANGTVWIPIAIFIALCALAVWVFRREAPRIAEEL
jgi:ABC-2 type transport system permease protein